MGISQLVQLRNVSTLLKHINLEHCKIDVLLKGILEIFKTPI